MSEIMANDVRAQYGKAFSTIRRIAEVFDDTRWLAPHGDEYNIPSRIAYHLAAVIDKQVAGGFRDKDFALKLPYGMWMEAKADGLPDREAYIAYFDGAVSRAQKVLDALDDDMLLSPIEPDRAWMGTTQMGAHLYLMRELSDHTGELNKMLIEDGGQDIWMAK